MSNQEFRSHFDASQFRQECWSQAKHLTTRLERERERGRDTSAVRDQVSDVLITIESLELYWCFPGVAACRDLRQMLQRGTYRTLNRQVHRLARLLVSEAYRRRAVAEIVESDSRGADLDDDDAQGSGSVAQVADARPYFEVLLVDDVAREEAAEFRRRLLDMRREEDQFIYDIVTVNNAEDALIAVKFNTNIQSCVLRYNFPATSDTDVDALRDYISTEEAEGLGQCSENDRSMVLGKLLNAARPEIDLFLNTDDPVENIATEVDSHFRRVFYSQEDYLELHLSILKGISERYETPFFTALRNYSQKPTGVFHALPISRGKSITRSHWIQDMGRFYGSNIFLAETSATSGGLDSLLQPHGPLKLAQACAARAFGARRTYFVTNGTSSANKIVTLALVRPGDIVLLSHDCHKSHHYALMLAGAYPVYMDAYPLNEISMYGAVPLESIKRELLELKEAGRLHLVRMVLLTNCTFDGLVYDPFRVMSELLAIKPDLIFLWDEAWFGFARFLPTYRGRTAMASARRLREMYRSDAYREAYAANQKARAAGEEGVDDESCPAMADPDLVRTRVYATQSTHKTLTSLRQGSMIHIHDQDFERSASEAFQEAYMTYTSTSPNYQILASLDVGRRQVELEGFELVRRSVELAMVLREQIQQHPLLRRFFRVLKVKDLVPPEHRSSGIDEFYTPDQGFLKMQDAWHHDEVTLDATRVTLHIGETGIDGDTFKNMLADRHDIQVNKTSRNTVLFMLNIGTSRGAIAYLLKVLVNIAKELDERLEHQGPNDSRIHKARVRSLTEELPPLPNFSHFHPAFQPDPEAGTREGDLREAYFLSYREKAIEYLSMGGELEAAMAEGREVVSASFVTPYPPGFPILVPGQVISEDILAYMKALDVKEIHGFQAAYGFRVFTEEAILERTSARRPRTAAKQATQMEST